MFRRAPVLWLFVFALLFRLVYIAQSTANPLFGVPMADARTYDDWAREMVRGGWLWDRVHYYLPIYPYFLAIQKLLLGENPIAIKWIQALMGAAGAAMIAAIGARLWSRRAGMIAGVLVATYWLLVVYESEEFAESFSIFFQTLTLFVLVCCGAAPLSFHIVAPRRGLYVGMARFPWVPQASPIVRPRGSRRAATHVTLLRSEEDPKSHEISNSHEIRKGMSPHEGSGVSPGWSFLAGLAYALSAGARPNLLMAFPLLVAWLVWRHWRSWRTAALSALAFAVGVALVFGPILVRNHRLSGAWLLRTQVGWVFYHGIDPQFDGLAIPPGVQFENFMRLPIRAGLRSDVDIERFWKEKTREVIRENPVGVLGTIAKRALILLTAREFPQELDVRAYRGYSWFLSLPWPGFWLAGPVGILGLFLRKRRSKEEVLVILVLLAGVASILPVKFADRYRLPLVPLLALFAGAAAWQMVEWARARRWRPFAAAITGLAALCLASWPDWPGLKDRQIARHFYFVGLHKKDIRKFDEAIDAFRKSMEEYPWDADSPYHIGEILIQQKRYDEAAATLNEALRREPEFPDAMTALAQISLEKGDWKKAEELTSASLRLYPNSIASLLLMARISFLRRDFSQEIRFYERALEEGAGDAVALDLGQRLEDLGRLKEALGYYEQVHERKMASDFARARALMLSGNLYARKHRDAERARACWKAIVREFPNETFYSNQARLLAGQMDESAFRGAAENDAAPAAREFDEYAIGLARWLRGDRAGALHSYEECLKLGGVKTDAVPAQLPQKWAWEDIQAIRRERETGTSK